jgi:protein arginine kinase
MKNKIHIKEMLTGKAEWIDSQGPNSDIVLSSRIRLARNFEEFHFPWKATVEMKEDVLKRGLELKNRCRYLKNAHFYRFSETGEIERQFLAERHLISPAFVKEKEYGGVVIGDREILSMILNEEDHLRMQGICSGFQLMMVWNMIRQLDEEIGSLYSYSYSKDWGHLTACPTNTGTGLRASVLIHLPGLVLTKQINEVLQGVTQVGLAVRGYYGEGTQVLGNLFQVSNQATLGLTEENIIESVEKVTMQIIGLERKERDRLMKDARAQMEDKIWRALGIMKSTRLITSEEVINLSSAARLGVSMGILKDLDIATLNEITLLSQPAHIQCLYDEEMSPFKRDFQRAVMVRERLANFCL